MLTGCFFLVAIVAFLAWFVISNRERNDGAGSLMGGSAPAAETLPPAWQPDGGGTA